MEFPTCWEGAGWVAQGAAMSSHISASGTEGSGDGVFDMPTASGGSWWKRRKRRIIIIGGRAAQSMLDLGLHIHFPFAAFST